MSQDVWPSARLSPAGPAGLAFSRSHGSSSHVAGRLAVRQTGSGPRSLVTGRQAVRQTVFGPRSLVAGRLAIRLIGLRHPVLDILVLETLVLVLVQVCPCFPMSGFS